MKKINPDKLRKEYEEFLDREFEHPKYQLTLQDILDDETIYDNDASVWHKASDPPSLLDGCEVSDWLILYTSDCEYWIGSYYHGKDGQFYVTGRTGLLRDVVAWMYLPKYDLDDYEECNDQERF